MKKVDKCFYCERDAEFQSKLFEICDLKTSKIFLCKDQTLPGRCTIMFHEHYDELFEIPKAERDVYIDDVCALAETIKELFGANKINYAIYGDEVSHVHFTLAPKYRGKIGFGGQFVLFPDDPIFLKDKEYKERMALIGKTVKEKRGII